MLTEELFRILEDISYVK